MKYLCWLNSSYHTDQELWQTDRKSVLPKREAIRKDSSETCFCLSHLLRNPDVLAQMLEYERCSEIFQSRLASSGVIQCHPLSHLEFFMFDVVSCGEAAQGSLFYSSSQQEAAMQRRVHITWVITEQIPTIWFQHRLVRELWGTPAKGKAAGSPVMLIHQLQLIFSSAVTKMARQDW